MAGNDNPDLRTMLVLGAGLVLLPLYQVRPAWAKAAFGLLLAGVGLHALVHRRIELKPRWRPARAYTGAAAVAIGLLLLLIGAGIVAGAGVF